MRVTLILIAFLSSLAHAGFEKISVKKLNLTYQDSYGEGTLEKVGLGYSLKNVQVPYRISIERTDEAFEVTSEFLDFSWIKPYKIFHNAEKFHATNTDFSIGDKIHFLESDSLSIMPKDRGLYEAHKVSVKCEGQGTGILKTRVLEDCRHKLDASVKRIEVPADFILYRILYSLPELQSELEFPGDNLIFTSRNGQFNLQLYIKYYVYAGLRANGRFHYENDYQTIAINVNQIKFGILNVTNFVMRRLQAVNKSPDIKIDPPWIRINIGTPNED